MEDLLLGKSLVTEIDEEIVFDQLPQKKGAIWSLLLASGYLKVADTWLDEKSRRYVYSLELTNQEVRLMFENMIADWFSDETVPYNAFVQALLRREVQKVSVVKDGAGGKVKQRRRGVNQQIVLYGHQMAHSVINFEGFPEGFRRRICYGQISSLSYD